MPNSKKDINGKLAANKASNAFDEAKQKVLTDATQTKFAQDATLLGKKAGAVVGGFTSLEGKLNGGGTTTGDALTSFTKDVGGGLSGVVDPALKELSLNGGSAQPVSDIIKQLTGLGAPVATLTEECVGGSSLKAIQESAALMSEKSGKLKDKINAVAGEVSGGGILAELSEKLGLPKLEDITKEISSIKDINPAAELLDKVNEVTGNSSLIANAQNTFNEIEANVQGVVGQVTKGIEGIISKIDTVGAQIIESINSDNPIKTGLGLVQDIAESLSKNASSFITQLGNKNPFSDSQMSDILQKISGGDPQQFASAIQQTVGNSLENSPEMEKIINSVESPTDTADFIRQVEVRSAEAGIPPAEVTATVTRIQSVETDFSEIDTTISGTVVKTAEDFFVEDTSVRDNINRYKGAKSDFNTFTYIDSKEELVSSIGDITRELTEVIIHASETYTNQNIGCEEIHTGQIERGFDGIQHHLVIRRDGRLQRGLPFDKISGAVEINGHSTNALDICLVGGLNCPTGTEDPLSYQSAQSFTQTQMRTLEAVLSTFYTFYPGGQVMGHNDLDVTVEDPYFDVVKYVETLFRKKSIYNDYLTEKAVTPKELITKRPV